MLPMSAAHASMDPTMHMLIVPFEIALFLYFIVSNLLYLWTATLALGGLPTYIKRHAANPLRTFHSPFEKPVSVIVPAFNESSNVVATVHSVLRFDYPEFEVIVVNDGSTDDTLPLLCAAFGLEPSAETYEAANFPTQDVRGIYRSRSHPSVCLVDKVNGGKADALNAGINVSSFPLLLCLDGDSLYVPETLMAMTEPFLHDPKTVVSAASISVSNGCEFRDGALVRARLPWTPIVAFQALEYLRAFLESRMGWARVNALGTVSGALGMYRKDVVVETGGFRTDVIWEDMEMTIRVHHYMSARKRPYRIAFAPYPVCWTMVPDTLVSLFKQRVGWHRHLSEVMTIHRGLLFRPGSGTIGWLSLPVLAFFEWLAPLVVLFGIGFGAFALYYGVLSVWSQIVLLMLVFALALTVSVTAVLLNETSFSTYAGDGMLRLMLFTMIENLGYRQFCTLANLAGTFRWMFFRRVQRRRVCGPFVRGYNPLVSANWRGRVASSGSPAERSTPL
jgi:cellulose synthase/poly-beta-1,6-N-acetylglucosamine synthase-like glycosyltransferase